MRFDRLIILLLLAAACKPTQQSVAKYEEDLSGLRPNIVSKPEDTLSNRSTTIQYASFVEPTGHIKSELDSLLKLDYKQNTKGRIVDGFRILIYSGTSRDEANRQRILFRGLFPELDPKVSYHQPNFRVKAGQFTKRLDAHRMYEEVKEEFPKAILIPERITLVY